MRTYIHIYITNTCVCMCSRVYKIYRESVSRYTYPHICFCRRWYPAYLHYAESVFAQNDSRVSLYCELIYVAPRVCLLKATRAFLCITSCGYRLQLAGSLDYYLCRSATQACVALRCRAICRPLWR